jgi:RHH-type transcriptional regulator, proline utilization regulon repressor / proline dehydrogenase / delta 1-pyrroline-5-carboxylate dehydrogenase
MKKVIAEMGGMSAIIIDEDADPDEAVVHVVQSAFGFQGQKCSACSRVIVLERVYERFTHRFLEAVRSVKIGPAEDPANFISPVVDGEMQKKIHGYVEIGKTEGGCSSRGRCRERVITLLRQFSPRFDSSIVLPRRGFSDPFSQS